MPTLGGGARWALGRTPFVPGMLLYVLVTGSLAHWFHGHRLLLGNPLVFTALLALFLAGSHERWQRLIGGGHLDNRMALRLTIANAGAAAMMTSAGWSFLVPGWAILISAMHIGWSGANTRRTAAVVATLVTIAAQAAAHAGLVPSVIPLMYSHGAALWGLLLALTALNNIGVSAARLHQAEARFRALVEKSSDVVTVLDAQGRMTFIGPALRHVTGWDPDELRDADRLAFVHPDDAPAARAALLRVVEAGDGAEVRFEARSRLQDGTWRWFETTMRNLLADPAVHGIVCNERDVTERRLHSDQLAHAAAHDGLTGLPNRTEMHRLLAAALPSADPGARVALLYIDLDGFKGVNDTYGHTAGDALLIATADRLRAGLGPADVLCRLGGDEFAAILTGVRDPALIDERVAGLAAAMREPFVLAGCTVRISASVGAAIAGSPGTDATALVERADMAMYAVKHGTAVR